MKYRKLRNIEVSASAAWDSATVTAQSHLKMNQSD